MQGHLPLSPTISNDDQLQGLEADGNHFSLEMEAGLMQLFKKYLPVVFFICRPRTSQKKKSCPPADPKDFASVPPSFTWGKAAQLQRKHPDLHLGPGLKALLGGTVLLSIWMQLCTRPRGSVPIPVIFGKACPHALIHKDKENLYEFFLC